MTYKTKITTCKIKDIAKIYKGKGLTLDKVNSFEGKPCILYGDLYTKYEKIAEDIIHKTIFDEGLLSKPNSVLIPGDTTADAWGMAKAVALKEKNVLLGSSINILELNDNCDNIFFAYYLSSKKRKDIAKLVEGSTILHLYGKDIKEIEITYPEFSEQKKIGCFFKEIDELIELKKKEISKYKDVFQIILKSTYSSISKKYGYIKLKDVCSYTNGKAHEKLIDEKGPYKLINSKFISSNGNIVKRVSKNLTPAKIGDIAIVLSDVPNGRALAKTFLITEEGYTVNQRVALLSSKNYDDLLLSLFVNRHKTLLSNDDGVSQTNLSKSDIINLEIPNLLNQQELSYTISALLNNMINVIKYKEKELSILKSKKKYYLNKIFC